MKLAKAGVGSTSYQQWDPGGENVVFNFEDKIVMKRGVLLGLLKKELLIVK